MSDPKTPGPQKGTTPTPSPSKPGELPRDDTERAEGVDESGSPLLDPDADPTNKGDPARPASP